MEGLFGEKVFSTGSLIWLWILLHAFVAIFIKVPLLYVVTAAVGICRWNVVANEVSQSWEMKENTNQLLKIGSNMLLTDLLMKRKFSISILSEIFTIFYLKKRGIVWALCSLKCINLRVFFWIMERQLVVHTFCPHIIHA